MATSKYPVTFRKPLLGKGSPCNPILLAIFYTSPSLVKAIMNSSEDKPLSSAVKKVFASLEKNGTHDASPVWDLIGEEILLNVDASKLFSQMCDLFDAELDNAATKSLGLEITTIIESGSKSSIGKPVAQYTLPLAPDTNTQGNVENLNDLFTKNFAIRQIDYTFPEDFEQVEAKQYNRISNVFNETVVVQLQRYRFDTASQTVFKLYDRVEFPDRVSGKNFVPYADENAAGGIGTCTLDLMAIVTHHDEEGYGLLLRPDLKGPWFSSFNDQPPEETSIEATFGGETDTHIAYLLFYKQSGGGSLIRRMSKAVMRRMSFRS